MHVQESANEGWLKLEYNDNNKGHEKIVAEGRHVQIFWNGELTVDHETDRSLKGYLGLQNHDAKSVVKFRNIRITEL